MREATIMIKKLFLALILVFNVSVLYISASSYADEISEREYIVGLGDVLEINVLGHSNLAIKAPVTSDGFISFPYIGRVAVKDKSLSDIEKEISKKLASGYIKYPVVTVSLSTFEVLKYFVYGVIKNPGRYVLENNTTVLKAISAAGGITPDGLFGDVKLRRMKKGSKAYQEIKLDLKNTAQSALNGDMPIEDEDILIIERNKEFFIYGEVGHPGKYVLEDNMTILRAIAAAGGLGKYGSLDRVKILRTIPGKNEYQNLKVDMKGAVSGQPGKDISIESGDIVLALESIL